MTVVAAWVYRDGQRVREASLEKPESWQVKDDEFIWIGLHEPDAEEMHKLAAYFHLHPLAVEDAMESRQLPKVEVYGEQLFIVTKTAALEGWKIVYGETDIFLGPHHIITVRHGASRTYADLRRRLEAAPALLRHGGDYVVHGVLDYVVDGYLPIVEALEEHVLTMERQVLDRPRHQYDVKRVFEMRRELIRFKRIIGPMSEVCSKLINLELPCIDDNIRPYFRDVFDHVRRVDAMVDGLREILTFVFEASALLEQQHQGDITRKLAAWAAILAVPTAIAGIYGMNFENMPELKTRYGYFVVLIVIALLCSFLYSRFKRAKWL
jgi:magnesium transporter